MVENWVNKVREDFPLFHNRRNEKSPIHFDSACTSPIPSPVIEAINEYYTGFPGCAGARRRQESFSYMVADAPGRAV